jgi:flagellar motor protein MotB
MMFGRRKRKDEEEGGVPAWIVSFSDMVTLLLAFFVLLQAFSHEIDPELFREGQGSFRRAIEGLGIPKWQMGKDNRFKKEWFIQRSPVEPDPLALEQVNIPDPELERVQKIFQELKKKLDSHSEDLEWRTLRVLATPIRFTPGSSELNDDGRKYLDDLAVTLRDTLPRQGSGLYVVGLAPDMSASKQQWIVSTQRAMAASKYLSGKVGASGRKWDLHAWGGAGRFGELPPGTFIGIVVMGAENGG